MTRFPFHYRKKTRPGQCPVAFCTNPSKPGHRLCARHHMQAWRARHPHESGYHQLRSRARTRGIVFSISLEEYVQALATFVPDPRFTGKSGLLSVDRIDPRRGYEPGNVRAIPLGLNSSRGNFMRAKGEYWRGHADLPESEEGPGGTPSDQVPDAAEGAGEPEGERGDTDSCQQEDIHPNHLATVHPALRPGETVSQVPF